VHHEVLYIGPTSELFTRIPEHITKIHPHSFTAKDNCNKLLYYETLAEYRMQLEEKNNLKKWSRSKDKIDFGFQSQWKDHLLASKIA